MKKFMAEFKEFISQGNVMDLAVGVIIGAAFGAIVKSLCDDVIMPCIQLIISKITGAKTIEEMTAVLNVGPIAFGNFIAAVLNFLIMAIIIFLMVKGINKLRNLKKKKEEAEEEATTKKCPYCCTEIDINATKCPHCTSDLKE